MKEVEIPFLEEFDNLIINGNKTATRRQMGFCKRHNIEIGDYFIKGNKKFQIKKIYLQRLRGMFYADYIKEGIWDLLYNAIPSEEYENIFLDDIFKEENLKNKFIEIWNKISEKYNRKLYNEDTIVEVIEWKVV